MSQTKVKPLLFRSSLSVRLYLLIVPTVILAISLLGYFDGRVATRMLDREVQRDTVRVASQLAEDLSRTGPNDRDSLKSWLGDLVETNPAISRIDVYLLDGDALTQFVTTSTSTARPITVDESTAIRENRLTVIPLFQEKERLLKVIAPFANPSGKGCITVTATLHESDLVGEVHDRIALFLVPGSILVLVLMLHYLFTRVLTQRIDRLIQAMTQARSGNLETRAPVEQPDELGTIAQCFNETMEDIARASRERDQLLAEVRDFNVQLQQKVKEATQELSTTNERLRRLNEDLLETQRRLTQAERTAVAGQMAATFAHEIGSPLSAISTHLQLMMEDPALDDDARRRMNLVQEQVSRITGFVEELLSETRTASQPRAPVQINQLLQQLLLFLEQHMERHHVKVETRFGTELPEIDANAQQLQQVFLNLLNNACDALPKGGKVQVETQAETNAEGQVFVAVRVSDNGIGIPAERHGHIFEPFFSTKELKHGTGLGLSIAAKIIRQHQGTIELQSTIGVGTTFTVRFPVVAHLPEPGLALAERRAT